MNKTALLVFAALGVGLVVMSSKTEPERKGVTLEPPPFTRTPKGRTLTPFEKSVMGRYFKPEVLNAAVLWFGRPASALAQEDDAETGTKTEAVATREGIYFKFENHELQTPEDLALLAHELVHVDQFMAGPISADQKAPNEVVAQRMQIAVKKDLDGTLTALMDGWQGPRFA